MKRLICLAVFVVAASSSLALEKRIATNGLSVAGDAQRFEVYARVALGGGAAFCAAGDFARSALGAGATDRVTVISALGPSETRPGQRSVVFRLSGPDAQPVFGGSVLIRPQRAGASLSVGHAQFLCSEADAIRLD